MFANPFAKLAALSMLCAGLLGAQSLSLVSGNGQLTISQFKTVLPLVVQATGSSGQPVPGVTVTWAVTSGPGYTADMSTTTDANGLTSTFFTGIAPDTYNSYFPSTVTASAGSSNANFFMTTVQSFNSATTQVVTPSVGATLTAPSGTTINGAVQIQVFVEGGLQSGAGLPNVGLSIADYQDHTLTPPASCNAPGGVALTDSTGTATCNLLVTGPPGTTELVGLIGGDFIENPSFYLQITPGTPCTYSLSASSQSFSSAAATGSVNVITTSGCSWTAASNASFVSITSGASGTGNGTVSYSVAANTGAARSGTMTIAGKTYTVNQSATSPSGLAITTTTLPVGSVGASYSATLSATGGQPPYTWSTSGQLPSGLTLTPSTGVISGTPGSAGVFGFTATVTDSAGNTASQSLSLTINGTSTGSFAITNVSFANGAVGQPYSQPLTAANQCITPFSANVTFAVTAGTLPTGLSISNNSITGTPQSAGAFPFTLTATDTCGHTATASFTILIGAAPGTQQMTVSAPSLSFTAQIGAPAPANQSINIGVNSGAPLSYSITVSTTSGGNWLIAQSPSTGITPSSFAVGISNYNSLTPGQYSGSIVISSLAANSPLTVSVTLTVVAAPAIVLQSPSSFSVSQLASSSQNFTTVTQEQIVLASGDGPVHFTASASTSDGNKWLIVLPAQGTTPATLTASIDTGGLPVGKYTGTIVIMPASGAPITVTITVTVTQEFPTPTSFVNGASFLSGPVSPGEIVTIFGSALGPVTAATLQLDQFGRVATTLAGTQVFFDETPAPLIYSSAGQLSVIAPYEIAGAATTSVSIQYLTLRSSGVTVPVATSAPGIFTINGQTQGAILNQDESVNSPGNGAEPGSIVSIFATGEGQTQPPGVDGIISQGQLAMPLLPVTVQIAGLNAQVLYAGAAPGEPAGVLQVNAMIPANVPRGVSVPVVITVGTVSSQNGVMVAIAP